MYDFQESFDLEDQLQISSYLFSPLVDLDLDKDNYVPTNLFTAPNSNHLPVAPGGGKKRRRPPTNNDDEKNVIKISHREIEKQRRQEMAKLYASLRSLLPLEYVKGKRSISDHMDQAVNYINNMQKNISQLRLKKEIGFTKNPNFSSSSSGNINAESCSDCFLSSTVTINLCGNGLEILIRLNRKDEVIFPVSKMMSKMLGEGLNVTSYLSTKTHDDATLYRFISEVDDPSCIDTVRLKKTLMDMIMHEPASQSQCKAQDLCIT